MHQFLCSKELRDWGEADNKFRKSTMKLTLWALPDAVGIDNRDFL